jgi:hypothetical protein
MFNRKKTASTPAQRLIGLISLPYRNHLFATRIYELREFNDRSFAAETSIDEEQDGRIVSHADQIGELIRVHLSRLQDAQLTRATLQ